MHNGIYKQEYVYVIVQIKLITKFNIDVSNCFSNRLQDKYKDEMLKSLDLLLESWSIIWMRKCSRVHQKISKWNNLNWIESSPEDHGKPQALKVNALLPLHQPPKIATYSGLFNFEDFRGLKDYLFV